MYYINTLKRELVDSNAYKLQPSLSERVIVDGHGCHTALHFGVKAKENQDKVPMLYWLPKLNKKPYKARFIAKTFSKFYRRYYDLISKFQVGLKSLLRQGLSEPDFYGDLEYKLKKIVASNNF